MNGEWTLDRTRGLVRKRIDGDRGWTLVAGIPIPFRVQGQRLRYPFAVEDELSPDGPDAYRGVAKVFGVPVGTFRMTRSNPGFKSGP